MPRMHSGAAKGFNLVELLVVMAITGVMIATFLPVVARAREHGMSKQCMSNQHGIAVALSAYAADYPSWYPTPLVVGSPDNPSGFRTAGTSIWGMGLDAWPGNPYTPGTKRAGPNGLGVLAPVGSAVTTPQDGVTYGSYVQSAYAFYCPSQVKDTGAWSVRNGGALNWFGQTWTIFPTPDLPGTWWSNANYGNYYLTSSYAYRGGYLGRWSGQTAGTFLQQWPDGQPPAGNATISNLRTDKPGNNRRALVADQGGSRDEGFYVANHGNLGGGNVLFGDGSAQFWANQDYAENQWNSVGTGFGNKYGNVSSGIAFDYHHRIYPNLLFAAIDRDLGRE